MAESVVIPDDLKSMAGKYGAARTDIVIPDDIAGLAGKYAPAEKPVKPAEPGLIDRMKASLADATPVQPRAVGERRGGMRSEGQPYAAADQPPPMAEVPIPEVPGYPATAAAPAPAGVGGVLADVRANDAARTGRLATFTGPSGETYPDPAAAPAPKAGASVLDRPADPNLSFRDASQQQLALKQRAGAALDDRMAQTKIGPASVAQTLALDIGESTSNPVARGGIAGVASLGKIGVGAVRVAADLFGAQDLSAAARGASGAAEATERGAMQGLAGNDKLVADVTNSIMNSAPSLAVGMVGGPALRALFMQSTLAEYNAGRDAGFDPGTSLARAGIMGTAEALGERFGFPEQIKLLKSLSGSMPTGQVAHLFGELLKKEIPGEQLTTAMQFLADKVGPAALQPNASMADYLEAAGETLKVTVAQTGVMGGGPTAIATTRNALANADAVTAAPETRIAAAIDQGAAAYGRYFTPPADAATVPTQARAASLKRFDELTAAFGLNPRAAAAVREQAGTRPAGDVPGFLQRVTGSLNRRGFFQRPVDEASVNALHDQLEAAALAGQKPAQPAAPVPEQPVLAPQAPPPAVETPVQPEAVEDEDYSGLATPSTGPTFNAPVDAFAHDAATSPINDRSEPSDAQKKAGNYAKGHVRIGGLDIAIENPQGSVRRGVAQDGTAWETPMAAHYGYVKGTRAGDGDNSDVFIKPGTPSDYSGPVFVIDQVDPKTGKFDEHKSILGASSAAEAQALYEANYTDGWKGAGAVTELPLQAFKSWVRDGVKRKPLGQLKEPERVQPDVAVSAPVAAGPADGGTADVQPGSAAVGLGSDERDGLVVAPDRPGAAAAVLPGTGSGDAAAVKVLGSFGRAPASADKVELRPNADGTVTPHTGKYPMVDFDTGAPIVLTADVSEADAVTAIRKAGAVTDSAKFFSAAARAPKADKPSPAGMPEVGTKVAIDGEAWTVRKVGKSSVSLEGHQGKKRTVSTDSPTWKAVMAKDATPQASEAPAAAAVAPDEAPAVPKVYKLRDAAEKARKELGNTHRMQKVKGGYILRQATDKELAAGERAGHRLATGGGVDVDKDTLLTAIAKLGGVSMKERADTVGEGNRNIGGKMLFTSGGKPLDMLAVEDLRDFGYVPQREVDADGGVRWLRSAIASEFMGTDTHYSEQGTGWMEDRRNEETRGDELSDWAVDDLQDAGYTAASPEVQAATEMLLADAEAAGLDTESLQERVAISAVEGTADEYHAQLQAAVREALAADRRSDAGADAGAAPRGDANRREPARKESAAEARPEGLTAPTPESLRAADERAREAEAKDRREQQRLADKAAADAQRDEFTLTGSDRAADVAAAAGQGGLFDAPAAPPAPPRPSATKTQPGDSDAVRKAKADLMAGLGDLAGLLSKGTRANIAPEVEQQLLPILTKVFDAAFRLGYLKFKDAARFVLEQVREAIGTEAADAITLDHLQGAYIGMAGRYKDQGASTKREVVAVEDKAEVEAASDNASEDIAHVPDTNSNLERYRAEPAAEVAGVGEAVRSDRPADGAGADDVEAGSRGRGRPDDQGLPVGGAAVARELGDQPVHRVDGTRQPAEFDAGAGERGRGDDPGIAGVQPDAIAASRVAASAVTGPDEAGKRQRQRLADSVAVAVGDLANIRETLPYLLPGQQEDVHKAETRFAQPNGYGMLFTNGTGTGKTFTGLGIVKRFASQGKTNTLIVVPDAKILSDWVKSAEALGLSIAPLEDTKSAGKGITVTTYANLGMNDELARRDWDLVVPDEAHSLMQAADGKDTLALDALRAITLHPRGTPTRFSMLHREEIERRKAIGEQITANERLMNADDTMDAMRASLGAENAKLQKQWDALHASLEASRKAINEDVAARQGAKRTRVAALSATPFAYEKTVDWAEGYLFEYGEASTSGAYNTPSAFGDFMIQHFGYRMRTGKLNEPDAKVDRGLMQRQFNGWLKKQGVLSGRMLDVAADYDRRFVLVDSAVGNAIDEAMDWIGTRRKETAEALKAQKTDDPTPNGWDYVQSELNDQLYGPQGHLVRRYLLEAIKAKEAVPIIREHLKLGRKVVVFHDFKKGGAVNPFGFTERSVPPRSAVPDMSAEDYAGLQGKLAARNSAVREFAAKFPQLAGDALLSDLISPIARFSQAFPNVLLINGDEKPKALLERYKHFNDDASGPIVALVQSAKNKGWSGHDTTGKHQRVLFNLGLPTQPTMSIQQEGRIYRTGQVTDAMFRYLNTGTNWERWAFAQTIAERASAAENLASGEQARALKDAFITGFEESDRFPPGHEGEGKGGKERDRLANAAISEYDRAKAFYWGTQKKNSRTKAQEGTDYFATPEPLGLKMVEWADGRGGEDALEPSAGHGAIARWFGETMSRTGIEPSNALGSRLAMVFDGKIVRGTFEELNVVNKYDVIAMNPPFGTAGRTAIDHVAKAAMHLREGGRIVALIPTGPAADAKFEKWFHGSEDRPRKPLATHPTLGAIYAGDTLTTNASWAKTGIVVSATSDVVTLKVEGMKSNTGVSMPAVQSIKPTGQRSVSIRPAEGLYLVADIRLPAVTFERAGTAVSTRVVVIEKPGPDKRAPQQINRDLSDIDDINELFARLENIDVPRRQKMEAPQPDAAPAAAGTARGVEAKLEKRMAQREGEAKAEATGLPIVEYVTGKGKTLRGVVRTDLNMAQAKQVDAFTFKKDGGFFIRLEHLPAMMEKYPPAAPAFRRAAPAAMAVEEVQNVVDAVTATWANAPPVLVVPNLQDPRLPQPIRDEDARQRLQGATGLPSGVVFQGRVYVVADAMRTSHEVARTLFHEALGHMGLRGAFGGALNPMLDQMSLLNRDAVVAKAREYGFSMDDLAQRRRAAEEVLAELAETRPSSNWIRQAVAAIRTWLRDNNLLRFFTADQALSDAEVVRTFIAPARRFIERAPNKRLSDMAAEPAFDRTDGEDIDELLQERGEQVVSLMDAQRRFNAGERIFVAHDMDSMDETPREILNITDMAGYTHDQMIALPDDVPMFSRQPQRDPVTATALARAGIGGPPSAKAKVAAYFAAALDLSRDRQAIADTFRQGALDQFHGIRQAVTREIGNLPVEQDPYIAARLANGGTSSVMRALLLHGQARWSSNHQHLEKVPDTVGLLDVLAPLGNEVNDWFGWMIGNRAARLMKEGRENNFTEEQVKALQALATPENKAKFQKASLQFAAFKRSVLDIGEGAGLINPESRAAWDHADYIPFYRGLDDKAVFSPTGRRGLAGQSSGIRTLKGGAAALNDPMENVLMNFSRLIDASLKNNAIRKTIGTLAQTDAVHKVGYDMASVVVPADQVRRQLIDAGTPAAVLDAIPPEAFEGMAKMWSIQAPNDPEVVRVMDGGRPQFYRINDHLLLRSLTSFVPFDFPGLGMMRGAKRLLTAMVTSTPEFMIRNWIRDSVAVQAIGRAGFNPAASVAGIAKAYRETGGFEPMLFAGASFQSGNINAADPKGTAIAMRRALRAKGLDASAVDSIMGTVIDTGVKFWEQYRSIGEAIENSNRQAVFEATGKAGGSTTAAAYEAKDLMDFSLRGSWAAYQILADVLPFFNARVQGLYRLGRADPKRVMTVGMTILLASVALGMANDGEPWYEELPDWDKDTYWHFRIGGKHFRLPKPFEIGVIFATIPERIGRSIKGLDGGKKTLSRLWANVRDQLAFDPVPQLIRPALNVWGNQDTFRDAPIESLADEGKLPHLRYNARTSSTMRALTAAAPGAADALALSPKRLEYLVNGYLGTVGMYALGVSDMVVNKIEGKPPGPSLRADDLPVVRSFYRDDPARGTVFETDLYKMKAEVDQIYRSITASVRDNPGEAKRLLLEEKDKLKVRGLVVGASKALAELGRERDRIYADPNLTPDQKREKVDALQQRRNDLARKVATDPRVKAAF